MRGRDKTMVSILADQVLCLRRSELHEDGSLLSVHELPFTTRYVQNPENPTVPKMIEEQRHHIDWISRDRAENDERYVQVIPFILLKDGDSFAVFPSKVGAALTLGVATHVRIDDRASYDVPDVLKLVNYAAKRKVFGTVTFEGTGVKGVTKKTVLGEIYMGNLDLLHRTHKGYASLWEVRGLVGTTLSAEEIEARFSEFTRWSQYAWELYKQAIG